MCDSLNPEGTASNPPPGEPLHEEVIEAVVTEVGAATGRSPLALDPLSEVVDPDALTAIVESGRANGASVTARFDYCGRHVTVSPDGVQVSGPDSTNG